MGFGQFIQVIRARWAVTLTIVLVVVALTVILSLVLPAQYTATTSVVVDFKPDPISTAVYGGATPPTVMATQVDVIRSDRVAQNVVRELRLSENTDLRQQWLSETGGQGTIEQWLAAIFLRKIDVEPSRDSSVIAINYTAPDPRFAAAITNGFADATIRATLDLRTDPAKRYSGFFDARSRDARTRLERAQQKLSDFQQRNGIVATDERLDIETSRLNELASQLVAIQAIANESSSRQAQAIGSRADRIQDVLNSPLISGLKADVNRAEARLQELSTRYGENHPQVREAKASLDEMHSRLTTETRRVASGVSVTNAINQQREVQVRNELEAQRAKVLKMKAVRDEGLVLAADVTNAQRAFDAVEARLQQSKLESQTTQANINVLSTALPPVKPSFPIMWLNVMIAVVLGGAIALATALLLELMDRRVRSIEDVVAALDVPLLGVISKPGSRALSRRKQSSLMRNRLLAALPSAKNA